MPGKIFISYRRNDGAAEARNIRDRLAGVFGSLNVFMDVDNLMAGKRFDRELEKALAQTSVFITVIGPRWMDLLAERQGSAERDYVREEIAAALARDVLVIPVLIGQSALPRAKDLPDDIRSLTLHQKHNISHEYFGRDMEALVAAIKADVVPSFMRRFRSAALVTSGLLVLLAAWVGLYQLGIPVWVPSMTSSTEAERVATEKAKTELLARTKAEAEAKRLIELEAELKREQQAREKAELETKIQRELAAQAKREQEVRARDEFDAKMRAEAQEQVRRDREFRAKAEAERLQAEAAAKQQAEAEAQVKREREARAARAEADRLRAEAAARRPTGEFGPMGLWCPGRWVAAGGGTMCQCHNGNWGNLVGNQVVCP